MPNTANTSAPPKVASAGRISSSPERTMTIAISVATSEKNAQRRAQTASREVGCVGDAAAGHQLQIRFSAAHSAASSSGGPRRGGAWR